MTTRTSVRRSITGPGRPGQAATAWRSVSGGAGDRHPHAETAVLLAFDLVTTLLRHSVLAYDGGAITVTVAANQAAAVRRAEEPCGTGRAFDAVRSTDLGLAHGFRECRA